MEDEKSMTVGDLREELEGGNQTTPVWFLDSRGIPQPFNSVTFEDARDFELGEGVVVILEYIKEA